MDVGQWATIAEQWKLTPRESDIARLQCEALGAKQIALRLGIRVSTTRWHIAKVYAKFGVQDHPELMLKVFIEVLRLRGAEPTLPE